MAADSPGPPEGVEQAGLGVHPIDEELMEDMRAVLQEDGSMLVAVFDAFKLKKPQDYTGTQLLKALGAKSFLAGRSAPQPRVLCLTVKRARSDSGFRPHLKLVKVSDATSSGYKVSKSLPLGQVAELRLPPAKPHHQINGQKLKVLEVRVPATAGLAGVNSAAGSRLGVDGSQDVTVQLGLHEEGELMMVLGLIMQLIRQSSLPLPKMVGIGRDEVDKWWASNRQAVLVAVGESGAGLLAAQAAGGAMQAGGAAAVLMSAKEEKDLGELMELYAMGYGDVAEFEKRLQEEHDALEAANVESVLANVPYVDSVVFQMRKVQGMLEDLDENLVVLGTKLKHMRDDIAAIEASNNMLERQARNNSRLLDTLQDVIADLRVPRDLTDTLENPSFEPDRPPTAIVRAAWKLHAQRQRLQRGSPTCISPHLLRLRVVSEAQKRMEGLAQRFVAKASNHLAALLNQAVEEHVAEVKRKAEKGDKSARLQAPDHGRLRVLSKQYQELVRVLKDLDGSCMAKLQQVYSQAVNMLIRRELRIISAELRKAAQADMHHNKVDYSLTNAAASRAPGAASSIATGGSDELSVASEMPGGGFRPPGSVLSKFSRGTATSAMSASVRMTPRARGGLYDGTSLSIPLSEGYQQLLETVIPFLLEEAEAAVSFLILHDEPGGEAKAGGRQGLSKRKSRRSAGTEDEEDGEEGRQRQLTAEGKGFVTTLFQGIEPEFQVLVDLTSKGHQRQIMCLPMLAVTSHWLAQLTSRPVAALVCRTLADCHERLRGSLTAFVGHQVQAVEAYVSKAAGGVKALHVLAFTSQFAIMANHVEIMLAQTAAEGIALGPSPGDGLPQRQRQWGQQEGGKGGGKGGKRGLLGKMSSSKSLGGKSGRSGGGGGKAEEEGEEETDLEAWELVMVGAGWDVRAEVDKVYEQLVGTMFSSLEAMAAMDAKHGERLRLENYTYFSQSVRPLVRYAATLGPFLTQAEARQEESMGAYVQQQLEWGRFWKLLEFSDRVDKQLQVVGLSPAEVCFQPGCSASEVRALLSSSMKEADKKLAKMFARVRKHLGTSSLAFKAWDKVKEELLHRYRRLEHQVQDCYPGLALPTPPQTLEVLIEKAAGQGAG